MWRLKLLLSSSAIAALALAGSTGATQQEQRDTRLKATTTAITVDVVVRDQRDRQSSATLKMWSGM